GPAFRLALMLMSMRYRLVRTLIRLLLRCGVDERDLERAVLRHQLKILRRGGIRPRFTGADRAFLAAAAGLLSRARWKSFLVGPAGSDGPGHSSSGGGPTASSLPARRPRRARDSRSSWWSRDRRGWSRSARGLPSPPLPMPSQYRPGSPARRWAHSRLHPPGW